MAGDRKRQFGKIPRWRIALSLTTMHAFHDDYFGSRWYDWEQRIKAGHDVEEDTLKKQYEKALKSVSPDDPYFVEFIAEDFINTRELTNNMYAALIVSIWSEMESFFKSLVRACYTARGERKKLPYDIKAISEEIERTTGIQIGKCKGHKVVDAIRILNNSYKHSNGYYRPEADKPHTQISKSLLNKWKIEEGCKIEYSKLPIEKIYLSFNAFCADMLKKFETKLKKRLGELKYGD